MDFLNKKVCIQESGEILFHRILYFEIKHIPGHIKKLTDDHSTDKTFDDWYEDHPIGTE